MSTALINLLIFFCVILATWFVYKLVASRNMLRGKLQRQKTITEDILKQLYHVEQSNRTATVSDLSGALKIRRRIILPVVVEMSNSALIESMNEVLKLTNSGREYALKIIRVHRLWEKYLAEKTGYKQADWHYLAEKMEHQLDEEQISKLSTQLGNPMFDPHGDPIPTKEGKVAPVKWVPLPAYLENTPGKIVHIEDEPGVIYQQILAKRIFVGSHIKMIKSNNNEIIIASEGQEHRFSPIIAANISIEPLNEDEVYEENAVRLSSLAMGEMAEVIGISKECRGANRRRLLDLGILPGTTIEVDLKSPMRDPIAYRVRNTSIALRNSLADRILINKIPSNGN